MKDILTDLEDMIDSVGLAQVLNALSEICRDKGRNALKNQDPVLAAEWQMDAYMLEELQVSIFVPNSLKVPDVPNVPTD